jgi:RNA-binding protein
MKAVILNSRQRKFLRARAHPLNVVVTIGAKGLTEAVKEEVELALSIHELIKIKLPADDKSVKQAMLDQMSKDLNAAQVQLIGRVGILFRPAKKPLITLP